MIFHENRLRADDSHEISYLIFSKSGKDVEKYFTSAAVMIGALRVDNLFLFQFVLTVLGFKYPTIFQG